MSDETAVILARMEAGFGSLSASLTGLSTNLSGLSTSLSGLVAKVDRLEVNVSKLETGQASLEAGQANLSAELVRVRSDVMDRIDRLQDAVRAQYDDTAVVAMSQERMERIAESAKDIASAASRQVTAQLLQITRIQADLRALKGGL